MAKEEKAVKKADKELNLKGTFISVMFVGIFIIISWVGAFALFLSR
ncbi:cytochrome c oxidase subunit 2A [Virgibacillus halophilus]